LGVYKALLLAGCAGTIAIASPAAAQQQTPDADEETGADILDTNTPGVDPSQAPGDAGAQGTIVVTGSRIARQDFEANSPIVTIDEALLEQSSTAAIEQNLNKLPQFTAAAGRTPTTGGGEIQATSTVTPGSATISLRGLGANRNLVLLDGRRAVPSNAAGIVDINTIPSAAVERVEIISGGASATYGADAVAGVTNFILKKNVQGLELDAQMGISQYGDNFEWQISGVMGSDFDDGRGNVSIAMSMNTREATYQRDRPWYQDLWANPNVGTNRLFVNAPGVTLGTARVDPAVFGQIFPGTTQACAGGQPLPNTINQACTGPSAGLISGFNVYANPDGSLFTVGRNQQGGQSFFTGPTQQGDLPYLRNNGQLNFVDTQSFLVLPLTRYNMLLRGNYEISDWVGVFAQGLFSQTNTRATLQGGSIVPGWDVFIPYGTGRYTGSAVHSNSFGSYGVPSSVILNGMNLTGLPNNVNAPNNPYVDTTPGDLSDNPTNPQFSAIYADQFACARAGGVGGCTNNELFGQFLPSDVQQLLNARTRRAVRGDAQFNPALPANQQPLISAANDPMTLYYNVPENRSGYTDVTTYELIAGFEGSVPGTDWTWEAFGQHGTTEVFTQQNGFFSLSRLRTVLTSPQFGTGFATNSNLASPRVNFGANFGSCTSGMNFFTTPWENISEDCKRAVRADLKNRVVTRQTVAEANVQGGLVELPAGELRFAAGASYRDLRFRFINDTINQQGTSFLDQAVGLYPSQDVDAGYSVKELYGELLVPVIGDLPLVESFSLELGGRMSSYDTTGTSWTYKVLGDWEVTDWLRFRGGYNRAERSPNASELFLAPSQVVTGNATGDICSQRSLIGVSANPTAAGNTAARAADIQAVCRTIMDRTGGAGTAADYYDNRALADQPQGPSGFAWVNQVGNPNLRPETADTWTAGAVIRSPFTNPWLSRLRFTVDWWNIKLNDAIGVQAPDALAFECLNPTFNPLVTGAAANPAQALQAATTQACSRVRYDPTPNLAPGTFDVTFLNAGRVDIMGLDAQLDWAMEVGPGTLTVNGLINYYLHYKSANLPGVPLVDYAGTLGPSQNNLNPGAFRYRTLVTVGYGIDQARIALQWQHLPSVEQAGFATFVPSATAPVYNQSPYPAYDLFNLNASYDITPDIGIRFGIDNLLNTAPPFGNVNTTADLTTGQLPGGGFNGTFYDVQGRRFYIGANLQF
jgi:outer membrane receptor protein involved in Fe transport